MHSLAGFIQLLLILSQSDYLPDLSAVWIRETPPAAMVPATTNTPVWRVPMTAVNDHPGQAVTGTYHRSKGILPPALPRKDRLPIPPSNTLPAGRVISSDKLYLVFCRLKIGA